MAPFDWIPTSGKFQQEDGGLKWDELEDTAFDRIITSVHDFCLFMRDLFVPNEAMLVPPEAGWQDITAESLSNLGKSNKVVEILRHMTYTKTRPTGDGYQILPDSGLCDWRNPNTLSTISGGDAEEIRITTETFEPAPPDVVGLCAGGRSCAIILLDCRHGIVYWHDCPEGRTTFGLNASWAAWGDDTDCESGEQTAWPVEEFFEYVKEKFRSMKQLPCGDHNLLAEKDDNNGRMERLREVYSRHGWPDDYRKTYCAKEFEEKNL